MGLIGLAYPLLSSCLQPLPIPAAVRIPAKQETSETPPRPPALVQESEVLKHLKPRKFAEASLAGGVKECVVAYNDARLSGHQSERILCEECQHPHLDMGEWIRVHRRHLCLECRMTFHSQDHNGETVGNPLAAVCKAIELS